MKTLQDPEAAETVQNKEIPAVDLPQLVRHYRVNLREVALQSLDKKVLRELCAALGIEVTTTRARSREAMANRLAHFADEMCIAVTWDERMPNARDLAPPP